MDSDVDCIYCHRVRHAFPQYSVLRGEFNIRTQAPRCHRHWRFRCAFCQRYQHFSALAWCEKDNLLFCRSCATSERIVREEFWGYSYYTRLTCRCCGEEWCTLERIEYEQGISGDLVQGAELGPEEYDTAPGGRSYRVVDVGQLDDNLLSRRWNDNAEGWNAAYGVLGDPLRAYAAPYGLLSSLLTPVGNRAILDAGCGSGYLSCLLAAQGAQVTAVDFSEEQLRLAQRRAAEQKLHIRFIHGTLTDMHQLPDSVFDAVVCVTVLSNIPEHQAALNEMARLLRDSGRLVLVEIHPCFSMRAFGKEMAVWDSQRFDEIRHWRVDNYFTTLADEVQYSSLPAPTITFRRTLSDYLNGICRAGLVIDALYEPVPTRSEIDDNPRVLGERDQRIPRFMVVRAIKVGGTGLVRISPGGCC